jgi:uncharacterized protein (DUF433 family)
MTVNAIPTIFRDSDDVPWINGTTTKVIEVVLNQRVGDSAPEELQPDMPHLTVDQIQAALAYYEAHREELDADIERRRQWTEGMRRSEEKPLRRDELLARTKSAE